VESLVEPDDFPLLFRSADAASLRGQRRFFGALRFRLGGLVVAALGATFSGAVGPVDAGGFLTLVAFAVALAAELYLALQRPDRDWYQGRAAAESAKTLAWRYAVRGRSFEASGSSKGSVDRSLLDALRTVLQDLESLDLGASTGDASQITPRMRELRAQDFSTRRQTYLEGRIRDQQAWYARKSARNGTLANRWTIAAVVVEFAGLVGGGLRAFGELDVDLLGVCAALAAAIAAWLQAKQHQTLATAYGVTAQELASVAAELETLSDEADWADFVGGAEEAISREHTLWRASRGLLR
jgi:hypothetical protein